MRDINKLTVAAGYMHITDQISIVSVPIIAALVFNASAKTIGILVALQSMAHLVGSIPFGIWVDRSNLKSLLMISAFISIFGCAGVAIFITANKLAWFAVGILFVGFGIVLFVLASLSAIPSMVAPEKLASANARLEMPRALTSFCIPLLLGFIINIKTVNWIFVLAAISAVCAASVLVSIKLNPQNQPQKSNVISELISGIWFVSRTRLLLAISLCAIFWNLAFAALIVVMVPLLVNAFYLSPNMLAHAMAAFGLGMISGTALMQNFASRIPANMILLFGPGSSVMAVFCLLLYKYMEPNFLVIGVFFFLGFGPSMWLVSQNTVRQLVTPIQMLGSVNAVIQTAIYGVRPIGALLGGLIVEANLMYGLSFVIASFALSFISAMCSDLRLLNNYSDLSPIN